MAKEYIERDYVLRTLASMHYPWTDFEDAYEIVQNTPAADVEQVKHGRWREGAALRVGGLMTSYPSVVCSDCGITFCDIINNHYYMYRFCPNCGAKMDGGDIQ